MSSKRTSDAFLSDAASTAARASWVGSNRTPSTCTPYRLYLHFGYPCPCRHGEEKMGARSAAFASARIFPFRGSVLNGNAQNPTGFPGNVFLVDDIGLYSLFRPTTKLSFLTPFSWSERKTPSGHWLHPCTPG